MKIVRYRNPPRSLAVGITYVPFVGAFPKIAPSTLPPLLASLARPMNRDDSVNASPIRCPPLVAPNETVAIPPTSLPKSKVIDEFVPESRVGCPERTFCGLATDPEVPCTAVGRTVRDVGERFSASIAPGGAATAASAAGNGCRPSWGGVGLVQRPRPPQAVGVESIAVAVVGTAGLSPQIGGVGATGHHVECGETPDEYPLERRSVLAAVLVGLARLAEDAVGVELSAGGSGIGELAGGGQSARVAGGFVQLNQGTDERALVVCPDRSAVVAAGVRVEPVVDQVGAVDHSGALEPAPSVLGSLPINGVTRNPAVKGSVQLNVKAVGHRVLVRPIGAPPHAATTHAVPVTGHVIRTRARGVQVPGVAGVVVCADPRQRPPAGVVEQVAAELA